MLNAPLLCFLVCKNGVYCSMFEVVEKDKSPKSLNALLQKLEEEGLVSESWLPILIHSHRFCRLWGS